MCILLWGQASACSDLALEGHTALLVPHFQAMWCFFLTHLDTSCHHASEALEALPEQMVVGLRILAQLQGWGNIPCGVVQRLHPAFLHPVLLSTHCVLG